MSNWTKIIPDGKGGFDAYEWSIATSLKVNIATIFVSILFVSLCSFIVPAWFIFFHIPSHKYQKRDAAVVTAIVLLYQLIDYKFGLLNWAIWHHFDELYIIMTSITLSLSVFLILITIFDDVIMDVLLSLRSFCLIVLIIAAGLFAKMTLKPNSYILKEKFKMCEFDDSLLVKAFDIKKENFKDEN